MTKAKEDFDSLVEMALAQGGTKDMLDARISSLKDIVYGEAFSKEMERFLARVTFDGTLATDKFKSYMLTTLTKILTDTRKALEGADSEEPDFPM